ncbi:MAG: hypothetical protein IJG00_01175 [Clostridia bacterium]|nr:hypothetical protein [Clostridia bacterium]
MEISILSTILAFIATICPCGRNTSTIYREVPPETETNTITINITNQNQNQ